MVLPKPARVAELADALDLGSSGQPWGFESPLSHHEPVLSLPAHHSQKKGGPKVELNVSVEDLSANQKRLQVEIPAHRVQAEIDKRYRELSKKARIKGFRPGKIPKSILKSYFGKSVEHEVSAQFIEESFPQALKETDLKPLVEGEVDDSKFDENGALVYTAVVDVCPPFELGVYKGLDLKRPSVEVTQELQDAELERIRQQHSQLKLVEPERPARVGDVVVLSLKTIIDGVDQPDADPTDQMVEIGKNALHPEFDQHLFGRSVGESFSVELDFPEDSSQKEMAGRRVRFEATVREIKEKVVPELNDEFAQEVGQQFETLEALKAEISSQLKSRLEESSSRYVREQVGEKLLQAASFELSQKVIDREVERMIDMFLGQFQSQGLKVDRNRFMTSEVKAEYRPQAEKSVRLRLILNAIAKQEAVTLSDADLEEIYQGIARMARMDPETVKRDFADSAIMEQAKESKVQDKVYEFIEAQATFTEEPPAEEPTAG